MHAYRVLLSHRDVRWPLLASTLARLTPGMIVLAIVLLMRDAGHSYAVAGLVTAAHQVGIGAFSPLQGRFADRYGQRRVLLPDAAGYLLGTSLLAWLAISGAGVPMLMVVAALTGAVFPPSTACVRVLLSHRFRTGHERETAFALTAIAVEIGFIIGPLLAVAVAESVGAAWAVVIAGGVAAIGASGLASTGASASVPLRDPSVPRRSALASGGVRIMVVTLGTMAVAFGVIDIAVPAVAELSGDRSAAGWLIAAIASGSLVGGLVYGGRVWPGTLVIRVRVLAVVLAIGFLILPFATGSLGRFAVALFVAGVFLSPLTIGAFELIDDLALPGTQTEAQQWTQAAVVAGVALGASLSGLAIEGSGPPAAFLVGALCIGVGALLVNLGRARLQREPVVRPTPPPTLAHPPAPR